MMRIPLVRKLVCHNFKRFAKDYLAIYRSSKPMVAKLVVTFTKERGYGDDWGNLVREQFGNKTENSRTYTNSLIKEEKYTNQKKWMKDTKYGKR